MSFDHHDIEIKSPITGDFRPFKKNFNFCKICWKYYILQGDKFMDEKNNDFDFDFMPIGQAIKKARTAQGMTREQLARIVDYDPRHLQAIENEGQYPSMELFIQLVTMFDVSVDEYIFPQKEVKKSTVRRRLDTQLDKLNDRELSVIEATVIGLCKVKEPVE